MRRRDGATEDGGRGALNDVASAALRPFPGARAMTPDELVAKNIAPIKPEFLVQRQASAPAPATVEAAKASIAAARTPSCVSLRLDKSSQHMHPLCRRCLTQQTLA